MKGFAVLILILFAVCAPVFTADFGGVVSGTINGKIAKDYDLLLDLNVRNGHYYPFKIIRTIVNFAKNKQLDISIPTKFTSLRLLIQATKNLILIKEAVTESLELSGNLHLDNNPSTLFLNINKNHFKLIGRGANLKIDPS